MNFPLKKTVQKKACHPSLRSSIPGRMRWESKELKRNPYFAAAVEQSLSQFSQISSATVNYRTGKILLQCHRELSKAKAREILLQSLAVSPLNKRELQEWLKRKKEAPQEKHHNHSHDSFCDHDHGDQKDDDHGGHAGCDHNHQDTSSYIRNLVVGGVTLLGIGIKRLIFGPSVLAANPVLFGISAAATIISGYPYIKGLWDSATGKGKITTDTLVGSATIASIILRESVTSLTVVWLLNLGEYLQSITLQRTEKAIRDLLEVGDEEVWLVRDEQEIQVPLEEIQPGDTIAIYSGSRIPVDGTILEGEATINEAPITGESIPSLKTSGAYLYAGTIVMAGSARVKVEKVGDDTAVGILVRRVEEASAVRAPIQTAGERFSGKLVPFSFLSSLLLFVITRDVRRALSMLLIACPCAAGLSTPTAVSAAIGNGAKQGVLIKGGAYLEAASKLDTVIFDKTGTLTIGTPEMKRVLSFDDEYTSEQVLKLAASGEIHSKHPLALAIVKYANEKEIVIPDHERCKAIIGRGMQADLDGNVILVGNASLMKDSKIPILEDIFQAYQKYTEKGETVMYVSFKGKIIGLLSVRDSIRETAKEVIQDLRHSGIQRIVVLTGDGEESAKKISEELGIEEWYSQLLPDDKYNFLQELRKQGNRVAMVGDGINDAPSLAIADVGIAMGTAGSDVAIEAADIALAGNDLRGVVTTLNLSQRSLDIIHQNYAMAIGVNSVGLVAGAMGSINPFMAALLHNVSTLLVVFNSARLIGGKEKKRREA